MGLRNQELKVDPRCPLNTTPPMQCSLALRIRISAGQDIHAPASLADRLLLSAAQRTRDLAFVGDAVVVSVQLWPVSGVALFDVVGAVGVCFLAAAPKAQE